MTDFLDHLVHRTLGLSPPLRRHLAVVVPAAEPAPPVDADWPSTSRPAESGGAVRTASGERAVTSAAAGRSVERAAAGAEPGSPALPVATTEFEPIPPAVPAEPDRRPERDPAPPRPRRVTEPVRQTNLAPPHARTATHVEPERPAVRQPAAGDDHRGTPDPVRADVVPGVAAEPAAVAVPVAPEVQEMIVAEQLSVTVEPQTTSVPLAGVVAPAAAKEFTAPARTRLPAPSPVAPVTPNVTVTIGTVVVRPAATTTATPAPARVRRSPTRSMSLDDYLSTREER